MYQLYYAKVNKKYFLFLFTLGIFESCITWQMRITLLLLSLFYTLDLIAIIASFGKITSVWHCKAGNLWFENNLYTLAANKDKQWNILIVKSTFQTFFLPEVI